MQIDNCTGPPYHKLDIMVALANNQEQQPFGEDSQIRHKAAAYRRELFAEMVRQGHPLQKRCTSCKEACSPHKASPMKDGPKTRLTIRKCLCLFHTSCLASLEAAGKGCPVCSVNAELEQQYSDHERNLFSFMRHSR